MTRLFLVLIALVSVLAVAPYAAEAQKPTATKGALPKSNQVYVKIILPIDPPTGDKNRPVVESWIAEQLKKRGQSKFFAATVWVPLADDKRKTEVWVDRGTPVDGWISKRADGRIKVILGSCIGWFEVTVSLRDEPGSRKIALSDYVDLVTEQRIIDGYVAVLIGPPSEKPAAAPIDPKK